ncbi:MAG TPA: prepilin-type N-terminal cleavage/methylation domain-containing protein [Pyrinomonadaceae bacterium]
MPSKRLQANAPRPPQRESESGFSLVEMVMAMLLMLIGLLALATVIGYAFMVSNKGRNITNSKLLVTSILEQMETLRNTNRLTFGQISNDVEVDNENASQDFEGFPTEFQPVSLNPGPDGIFGTTDDLLDAGTDGDYGTQDDFTNEGLAHPGYSRQIIITKLNPDLKRVQVTLRYPGDKGKVYTKVGVSYLNNDVRGNFRP